MAAKKHFFNDVGNLLYRRFLLVSRVFQVWLDNPTGFWSHCKIADKFTVVNSRFDIGIQSFLLDRTRTYNDDEVKNDSDEGEDGDDFETHRWPCLTVKILHFKAGDVCDLYLSSENFLLLVLTEEHTKDDVLRIRNHRTDVPRLVKKCTSPSTLLGSGNFVVVEGTSEFTLNALRDCQIFLVSDSSLHIYETETLNTDPALELIASSARAFANLTRNIPVAEKSAVDVDRLIQEVLLRDDPDEEAEMRTGRLRELDEGDEVVAD